MDVRVVSIGAMEANALWGERGPARTGHATTTLIRVKDGSRERVIVVDPGLPGAAVTARLGERAGLTPADVTDVFLTTWRPDARRGLEAFADAAWWLHADEAAAARAGLSAAERVLARRGDEAGRRAAGEEAARLARCRAPEDEFAPHVALFPLAGVTPGCCGLLVEDVRHTLLVCGDAVATAEHLERGQVPAGAWDVEKARASLAEVVEVADLVIPGRDNVCVNRTKRAF